MILKNLFRRKGRTILTLIGISIGVAAIIALGAISKGLKAGFAAMTQGSQADLVISQAESLSALVSSVDETVGDEVCSLPGVADVNGMLYTNALLDNTTYLILFGYDPDGFAIDHFRIVEGQALAEARGVLLSIVGAAGLEPTLAAAQLGRRIALANKESLVVGGDLVREAGLSPADLRKDGAGFDLPIALGILTATRQLPAGSVGSNPALPLCLFATQELAGSAGRGHNRRSCP